MPLRTAKKLDRYREPARMALEAWLVEAVLDRVRQEVYYREALALDAVVVRCPNETWGEVPVAPFPMGLELLFDRFGKLPKRDAFRWIKYFTTAMRSDREYGTSLCKIMGTRETSSGRGSAKSAKLSAGVPPLGDIHFAKSRNDQSKFQQAIEIYSCLRHWPRSRLKSLSNPLVVKQ